MALLFCLKLSVEKVSIHTGYLSKSNETFTIQNVWSSPRNIQDLFILHKRKRNFLLEFSFPFSILVKNIRKENENENESNRRMKEKPFFMGICYSEKKFNDLRIFLDINLNSFISVPFPVPPEKRTTIKL